jgi:hypothetical protein
MIFKIRYALFVNAGCSVYQSQRTIAESSNYDDESHGQGASIATDPRNLQTDSGWHQFAHVCQQLSACQYYGDIVEFCRVVADNLDKLTTAPCSATTASKMILPPWKLFWLTRIATSKCVQSCRNSTRRSLVIPSQAVTQRSQIT